MYEILNGDKKQISIRILKKCFHKESELMKELSLYQTLLKKTENDPKELLNLVIECRGNLNHKKLDQEKYNLVRMIRMNYDLKTFFETRTSNYRNVAAIYKLFEFRSNSERPDEYLSSRNLILETLSGKVEPLIENTIEERWRREDKGTRKLALSILIEKFNEHFKDLNMKQKKLLSKFIHHDISNPEFKNYVLSEVKESISKLDILKKNVKDEITVIKLNETISLADKILNSPQIQDSHLSALLKYYELIQELEN